MTIPALIIAITSAFAPLLPACATEDGTAGQACLWDADTAGNGEGITSVILADGSQVLVELPERAR